MTDKLTIPAGMKTGCLPRVSRYGEWADKLEDRIDVIPREEWSEYIGEVDLRPNVTEVLSQNGAGSCAAESTTQGLMIVRSFQNQPFELLNPWSVYAFTSGGVDRGSSIDENWRHVRDVGVLPMSVWPRSNTWRRKPPQSLLDTVAVKYRLDEVFDIGSIDEIGTALIKAMPVVFGWRGHSCVLTKLLDRDLAEYCNSWGDWGDKGFGKIRLSSINLGYGSFAVRNSVDAGA